MAWRTLAFVAVLLALLANVAPASAAKPPLRNACKLVTNDEIKDLMGRKPVAKRGLTADGCVWTTRRAVPGDNGRNAEAAGVSLSGFTSLAQAKEYVDLSLAPGGCGEWERFLPRSKLGDEAYLQGCNSNIMFRLGRIVGHVTTYTNGVREESSADTRRTAKLTRTFVKRLAGYRCGSFCR